MLNHSISTSSWRARSAAWVRVSSFLCLVGLGSLYLCVRGVRAETERTFVPLGGQLSAQLGTAFLGTPQALQINGQTLFFSAKSTQLSIHDVLERFDASCDAASNVDEQLALLPEVLASPQLTAAASALVRRAAKLPASVVELLVQPTRLGVLRNESGTEGHFVCLAQPPQRRGLAGVLRAVREFAASGDVSRLGQLRYVTARKLDTGKTQVLAVWSEGPLLLAALFPKTGDAPGNDMANVARPRGSRRLFHTTTPGRDYALRLYETPRSAASVLAEYDRELPERGWQALPLMLDAGRLRPNVFARTFTRAGHAVAIAVDAAVPEHTSISLIDLGSVAHSAHEHHAAVLP